jgi:glutamate-ammonia-ligase adenylyltransferase
LTHIIASLEKAGYQVTPGSETWSVIKRVADVSPHFASVLAANPPLAASLKTPSADDDMQPPLPLLQAAVTDAATYSEGMASLRRAWSRQLLHIAIHDIYGLLSLSEAKRHQTELAEASIEVALGIVKNELRRRYGRHMPDPRLAVLALGKLGGNSLDYDSDLDLLLVYDEPTAVPDGISTAEFYSVAVELVVNTLSAVTRDGHLYRIDLRLRPYGSKGLSSMPASGFLQYLRETAEVWEMLAFVKLRAVGGDMALASATEAEARAVIHSRAHELEDNVLRRETARIRTALEQKRSRVRRSGDIDIKYGAGGLLDVYFAARYLQLKYNLPDDVNDRSTTGVLGRLRNKGVLTDEVYEGLVTGYDFLSRLDHAMRLTVGRTTRLPAGDETTLGLIASRMGFTANMELLQELTIHRLTIRDAYTAVLSA